MTLALRAAGRADLADLRACAALRAAFLAGFLVLGAFFAAIIFSVPVQSSAGL
jgi:hypothetical protein